MCFQEYGLPDKESKWGNSQFSTDFVHPEFEVSIVQHDKLGNQAFVEIGICSSKLKMKLDTGAQVNIIPNSKYKSLLKQALIKRTNNCLRGYDGNALKVVGYVNIPCTYKEKKHQWKNFTLLILPQLPQF